MRNSQTDLALLWGDRAMALSAQVSADPKLSAVEAQMAIGSALMRAGHPDGVAWLTRCIQEARALGHYKALISASMYLCESHQRQYRFAEAEVVCEQSIVAFSETGYLLHYFLGLQALLLVYRGDYAQAMARASTVLDRLNGPPTVMQWPLLLAAGLARCRHGTPGGLALLQQCFELSQGFTAYYLLPATNALIEAQMLQGDPDSARATLLRGWAGRGHETSPWLIAPLKAWALRLNVPLAPDPPPGAADRNAPQPWPAATPFEREMAGDHAGAAAFWAEAQAPYEQAYMLMRCGSVGVQQAIELWSKLGAHPAESRARAEARQMGLRGVRRGPYGAGRHNPLGLSARELQVLHLLSEGHSNAHIARLLTRSERTIEHHVSSMLAKAGAPHRSALVQQARSAGLLGHPAAAHLQN
jgi:DNA-binding CsgD family transcriptional regulator